MSSNIIRTSIRNNHQLWQKISSNEYNKLNKPLILTIVVSLQNCFKSMTLTAGVIVYSWSNHHLKVKNKFWPRVKRGGFKCMERTQLKVQNQVIEHMHEIIPIK